MKEGKNLDSLSAGKKMAITFVMFALIFLSELVGVGEELRSFIYELGILTIAAMVFLLFFDMLEDFDNIDKKSC